jgi:hypothetical protein
MRTAIVIAAVSVLAATAAFVTPRHAKEPHITMLSVHVVKDPILTAGLLSPEPTVPQKHESFVAGWPLAMVR